MPITAFGSLISSNPTAFPGSDQIAVGKHLIYIMQNPDVLEYATKHDLVKKGQVSISINVQDNIMPGMVWFDNKLYLFDNNDDLYSLPTDPNTGIPSATLTKIAKLPISVDGEFCQLGFDYKRKLILYKESDATIVYFIDPLNTSSKGTYGISGGTNFAGDMFSSNFFVDCDGYMYVGIADSYRPDVRILKTTSPNLPLTFTLDRQISSGASVCDRLYPDPFNSTVVYTNSHDKTVILYNVVGTINMNNVVPPEKPSNINVPRKGFINQNVEVNWSVVSLPTQSGISLDQNIVFYELNFYNGSQWNIIDDHLTDNSCYMIIPELPDVTMTQFRVRSFIFYEQEKVFNNNNNDEYLFSQKVVIFVLSDCHTKYTIVYHSDHIFTILFLNPS